MALILSMSVSSFVGGVNAKKANAEATVVEKECKVIEGEKVVLQDSEEIYEGCKVENADDSIAKVTKRNDGVDGAMVKGKKVGSVEIKLISSETTFVYKVQVLSKKSVNQEAMKALKKITIKKGKKYAFADLNGDGVKDLFLGKNIYGYNYLTKKVVKKYTGIKPKNLAAIYVSTNKKMLYMQAKKGKKIGRRGKVSKNDPYTGKVVGAFYGFWDERYDTSMFFERDKEYYIIKYDKPKNFVKNYKKGKKYYCFNDDHYDQDDYWYMPFTEKKIMKKVKSKMGKMKKVKLKTL